ncbi:hypothetical protein RhiTH_003641 [Rhizoctonia solani]
MHIHNVFYVGLLSKVNRDKKQAFENCPPLVTVEGEEEYKGYGSEENTWEPQENLKNVAKILKKYEEEMRKKALGTAKALRGGAVL